MGIGLWEILLLMGIALVVMGPEKFPDFAKLVFRTVRELRGYVDEMKREISDELKPIQKEVKDLQRYNPEQYIDALTRETKGPTTPDPKAAAAPASTAGTPAAQPTTTPVSPAAPKPGAESAEKPAGDPKPYHNPYVDGGEPATSSPKPASDDAGKDAPKDAARDASEPAKPKPGVRPSTPPPDSRPADGYDD